MIVLACAARYIKTRRWHVLTNRLRSTVVFPKGDVAEKIGKCSGQFAYERPGGHYGRTNPVPPRLSSGSAALSLD